MMYRNNKARLLAGFVLNLVGPGELKRRIG